MKRRVKRYKCVNCSYLDNIILRDSFMTYVCPCCKFVAKFCTVCEVEELNKKQYEGEKIKR
jgi:hypothetical protein